MELYSVAVLVLFAIGATCGTVLSVASKVFYVWEDPRIDGVEELLPSTNCGACSRPGCRAFAEALVAGEQQPSDCTVMSEDDREDVAAYLGVDAGEANKRVARLLCAGGKDEAPAPTAAPVPTSGPGQAMIAINEPDQGQALGWSSNQWISVGLVIAGAAVLVVSDRGISVRILLNSACIVAPV